MKTDSPALLLEPGRVLYFGCDMLEFLHDHSRLRFAFDPEGVDVDNSASGYVEIPFVRGEPETFTYRRIASGSSAYSSAFGFSFVHGKKVVDAFALFYAGTKGTVRGRAKVVVYSTFFAVSRRIPGFGLSGLREFLDRNFEIEDGSLWRADVCADFAIPLPVLTSTLFDAVGQWYGVIGKDGKHEGFGQTYYTNEIQNTKNRNRLFRVYDKVLDSFKKGKSWLFPHLSGQEEVRRVELELRPDYCQRLARHPLDFVDRETLLKAVFLSNLADYTTFPLAKLDLLAYPRYESDLSEKFLELGQLPNSYVSRANGYVRRVREASGQFGMCHLLYGIRGSSQPGRLQEGHFSPFDFVGTSVRYAVEVLGIPPYKARRFLESLLSSDYLSIPGQHRKKKQASISSTSSTRTETTRTKPV